MREMRRWIRARAYRGARVGAVMGPLVATAVTGVVLELGFWKMFASFGLGMSFGQALVSFVQWMDETEGEP